MELRGIYIYLKNICGTFLELGWFLVLLLNQIINHHTSFTRHIQNSVAIGADCFTSSYILERIKKKFVLLNWLELNSGIPLNQLCFKIAKVFGSLKFTKNLSIDCIYQFKCI